MSASRPAVHPVEAPPMTEAAEVPVRVRMKDMQGSPGTVGGLVLRLLQFFFAVAAISVMATTDDFASVTAFRYLVAATGLQCLWSLSLAFVDIYALLVMRSLRNPRVMCMFFFGDGITWILTLAAACSSAGITVLIGNDLGLCNENHCGKFETATAMAFISWVATSPSFIFNFWTLAFRSYHV